MTIWSPVNEPRAFGLGFVARALDDLGQPPPAIGVPLTLVMLAATCAVARAVTRTITLRG